MNVVLWFIASLLAAAFLAAGLMKAIQPKDKLVQSRGMEWTEDFSGGTIRLIGVLETLAAIGLILPAALGIVPVLVPLAALGLALTMAGAVIVHVRRKNPEGLVVTAILLVLAVIVVWGRFGPYAFTS
jgi:uncharacterized membrane protein YphA (DoxX/SURF4 family)